MLNSITIDHRDLRASGTRPPATAVCHYLVSMAVSPDQTEMWGGLSQLGGSELEANERLLEGILAVEDVDSVYTTFSGPEGH